MPSETLPSTLLATLLSGVRVLTIAQPHMHTAGVSVFVRTGSAHETRANNGVSHVLEHMAFKGTTRRNVQRVNLDAERLGAEVNAHTDKDHTAYTMRGLASDAPEFVHMLGDIVRHATFPEDELEREREVILQEVAEVEDDPVTVAYHLFDNACWGLHPAALPVIGQQRHIERFTRADLVALVERQYTGANIVVAAAGGIDAQAVQRAAEQAFTGMRMGTPNAVEAPRFEGGIRSKRMDVGQQTHLVMGFPIPGLACDDAADEVAAAIFGDGMSSPLLAELREKRGLVYHAACVAERFDYGGQFIVEASFSPRRLEDVLREVARLLCEQARQIDAEHLERARKQLEVRALRSEEHVSSRLEACALDLFVRGRVRTAEQRVQRIREVTPAQVRAAFDRMLAGGPAVAVTGSLGRGVAQRVELALAALLQRRAH
jgi:predicted Zn-dependent peptidase